MNLRLLFAILLVVLLSGCHSICNSNESCAPDDDDSVSSVLLDVSASLDGYNKEGIFVHVDGQLAGMTLLEGFGVTAGKHHIDVFDMNVVEAGYPVTHRGHQKINPDTDQAHDVAMFAIVEGNWRCEIEENGYVDYDADVYTDDKGHIQGLSLLGGDLVVNGHEFFYYQSQSGGSSTGTISLGHRRVDGIYTFSSGDNFQVTCTRFD